MNKEILKRNIDQAIMQPCIANPWNSHSTEVRQNGLSEDGTSIMVKIRPDDSSWQCNLEWKGQRLDYVQDILDHLPERYASHLVTLRHDKWVSYSYVPVFDTDIQAEWDDALEKFYKAKQEWCDKYGCD